MAALAPAEVPLPFSHDVAGCRFQPAQHINDDVAPGGIVEDSDDAASIVNISINPQQSRLASSKTPVAEKNNALALGLDGADEPELHDDYSPLTPRVPASFDDHRPPSPWRARLHLFDTSQVVKRNRLMKPIDARSDSWSSQFLSALSNLPKWFHIPNPAARQPRKTAKFPPRRLHEAASPAKSIMHGGATTAQPQSATPSLRAVDSSGPLQMTLNPVPSLRRSVSALSPVSSLGDDTRFENVPVQVNSRLQAIKDGWQDASFKLPALSAFKSMPSIAALSLDSIKPGFAFARSLSSRLGTPQHSSDALNDGTMPIKSAPEPQLAPFEQACRDLTGDLVIMGGYRGSVLRSAEPPYRQVWVPIKVGLNVRRVDLEVGLEPEDDEKMASKIFPSSMLTHVGPVSISKRLFSQLYACENAQTGKLNVSNYAYDWRLDPSLLSRQLIKYLEGLPCNQPGVPKEKRGATIIAHSLGGLITRHVINQRPELVAGVIYAGTPQQTVSILGPLRNGDDVLLSSRVLTAQVNFSFRTSFALLPLDGKGFLNPETKEEFLVDFFDPKTWGEYRLSPCVARPLPALPSAPSGLPSMVNLLASKLPVRRNSLPNASVTSTLAARRRSATLNPNMSKKINTTESATKGNVVAAPSQEAMHSNTDSVATAVTITRDQATKYLTRVLADVKRFKQELAYQPDLGDTNTYPPAAVIYGKSTPTVYGAKVADREAIKRRDAYDNIMFQSGDGVVLSRAAMLPEGYKNIPGGRVSSQRGHVTLLGDLDAVGKAINAVVAARRKGFGLGTGTERRPRDERDAKDYLCYLG